MDTKTHWEKLYKTKAPEAVSWYRPHLETSLALIERAAESRSASIIDVGGGESTLVDDLLLCGYKNITVLDISQTAIDLTRRRLGSPSEQLRWLAGDITEIELQHGAYDLWHDRAVFHFLTARERRIAYVRQVARSVKRGATSLSARLARRVPRNAAGSMWCVTTPNRFMRSLACASGWRRVPRSFTTLPLAPPNNSSIATAESSESAPAPKTASAVRCGFPNRCPGLLRLESCRSPALKGNYGPDRFHDSEWPCALEKTVSRSQRTGHRERQEKPRAALLQCVRDHHGGHGNQPKDRERFHFCSARSRRFTNLNPGFPI